MNSSKDKSEDDYLPLFCSAKLMSILCNLMESSVTIQQQMMQNRGFLVIGYLLEKVSAEFTKLIQFRPFYPIKGIQRATRLYIVNII